MKLRFLAASAWGLALVLLQVSAVWPPSGLTQTPGTPESETVLWVYDLRRPPVEVPRQFAVWAVPVALCESGFNDAAVGALGELGMLQIHVRVHGPRMRAMGLDPAEGGDRFRFAVVLHREQGSAPWTCGKEAEKK